MKLEFLFGLASIALGLEIGNAGVLFVGAFFVLIVVVEILHRWIRRECLLWRQVVRQEDPHVVSRSDRRAA